MEGPDSDPAAGADPEWNEALAEAGGDRQLLAKLAEIFLEEGAVLVIEARKPCTSVVDSFADDGVNRTEWAADRILDHVSTRVTFQDAFSFLLGFGPIRFWERDANRLAKFAREVTFLFEL